MKVALVVPRSFNPKQMYREYPLGVGFLGTILRQRGHDVLVIDQNVEGTDDDLLARRIDAFQAEAVGFSVITPNYPVARSQMRRLRRERPNVFIVAGGIHANLFPHDLLDDGADVVVLGEGEWTLPALLERRIAGRSFDDLDAVVYRSGDTVVRRPGEGRGVRLDDLPIVDRSLYTLDKYTHHSMVASRGCPFKCSFCCNYTGTILTKGVSTREHERVVDEMIHLRDVHGAREIFFVDDIFLLSNAHAKSFCRDVISRRVGLSWIGQMRVDTVDDELADLMVQAGCQRVYFGVESGSDVILRAAQKGIDCARIKRGISAAKRAGLRVKTGWIYGLPGSLEEQYASIPFMLELRPHEISVHQLIPFPGTVYYSDHTRHGIRIRDPKDFESFCYGGLAGNVTFDYLGHEELVRLLERTAAALEAEGYVSSDAAGPGDRFVYTTPLNTLSMNVFRRSHT